MLKQTLVGKVIGTLLKGSPPWTPLFGPLPLLTTPI